MPLRDKIETDYKNSLKSKDKAKISTYRLILAGIKDLDIINRSSPEKKDTNDEDIKKPLSKMILFGELTTGGMVEVSLSDDVVPKLKINFKAAEVLKVKAKKENEKTPQ